MTIPLAIFPATPAEMPESDRMASAPHPREMLDLLGQEEAERAFLALHASGKMHHAFLLTGPEGVGKATFAYRAARFLLEGAAEAGGGLFGTPETLFVGTDARTTHLIAHESHPDLAILRRRYDPKTKKFRQDISVEDTRGVMALFEKTAAFGGWRIIIVDAADDLNAASANALLKTLEEPPPRALFFLVAHQPQRLLPTIRSRCRTLAFQPLGEAHLARLIAALRPEAEAKTVDEALGRAGGSIRTALRLLEPGFLASLRQIESVLEALPRRQPAAVLKIAESLRAGSEGEQAFADFLDAVEHWLSARIRTSLSHGESVERLAAYAELWSSMRGQAQMVEAMNLDRRAFALGLVEQLSTLV